MVFGRRRDSAGASMERALRALSPRTSNRAAQTNKKSTTPKACSTSTKVDSEEEAVKVAIRIRPLAGQNNDPQVGGRAWQASREKNTIAEISADKNFSTCSQ